MYSLYLDSSNDPEDAGVPKLLLSYKSAYQFDYRWPPVFSKASQIIDIEAMKKEDLCNTLPPKFVCKHPCKCKAPCPKEPQKPKPVDPARLVYLKGVKSEYHDKFYKDAPIESLPPKGISSEVVHEYMHQKREPSSPLEDWLMVPLNEREASRHYPKCYKPDIVPAYDEYRFRFVDEKKEQIPKKEKLMYPPELQKAIVENTGVSERIKYLRKSVKEFKE